jgi:pentatricopeptide repeat protein
MSGISHLKAVRLFHQGKQQYDLADQISKCRSVDGAFSIYSTTLTRSDVVYRAMIRVCREFGVPSRAFSVWRDFCTGYSQVPQPALIMNMLSICSTVGTQEALVVGKSVQAFISQKQIKRDSTMDTALLSMYVKCKDPHSAMDIWHDMKRRSVPVDSVTKLCVLTACANIGSSALQEAESLYTTVSIADMRSNFRLFIAVLNMFVKCGKPQQAIKLWEELSKTGPLLNTTSAAMVLMACAELGDTSALQFAEKIYGSFGGHNDVRFFNTLLVTYIKCGSPQKTLDLWQNFLSGMKYQWLFLS